MMLGAQHINRILTTILLFYRLNDSIKIISDYINIELLSYWKHLVFLMFLLIQVKIFDTKPENLIPSF